MDRDPAVEATPEPAVEVRDLTRRFGDFLAVDQVSSASAGQIFAFWGQRRRQDDHHAHALRLLLPSSGSGTVAGFDIVRRTSGSRPASAT